MDSAISIFEKGIPFARLLNDTVGEAKLLGNIGNAWLHKKDRVTAIEYYLKAARNMGNLQQPEIPYRCSIPISMHY